MQDLTPSFCEYDGDGNRTYESYRSVTDAYVYTQARVVYDALNRVTSINDLLYSVTYEYDAVGNRRHMAATYHDYVQNTKQSQDYWYAYDGLNRFTVTMGQLSGARATSADDASVTVVAGNNGGDGVYLAYDAAGQRKLATYASDGRTELYNYDALGYLTTQTINGVKTSERTNDQLGRVTNYAEWLADGSKQVTNLVKTYDADGLQKTERDTINASTTTYTRLADGTLSQVKVVPDDADKGTTMTMNYAYEWWDGAKQSKITSQGTNPNAPGWKPANSLFNYDVNGNLKATFDDGGGELAKQRAFSYETDQQGQILRRNELGGVTINANDQVTGASTDRIHNFYYLNGHRIGNVGNDGIEKIDYVKELAGKLDKGNDNTYKIFTPISAVDFDENYMKISGNYPAMSADSWTVREGDTLQSIAAATWGDSSLWYIIADANGLKGEDVLKAGQVLKVPNNVVNVHNTATTFKPYDPGMAIGNTQPTLPTPPPPPGKEGCGGIGTIIAIVVAIVATVFTAGAALTLIAPTLTAGMTVMGAGMAALAGSIGGVGLGMAGVAAAAIGGAVGAAASQGAMMAMGMQDSFNWKGVALGAIGAGATSGVGSYFSAGAVAAPTATTANTANAAASSSISAADIAKAFGQGALRNVATQGIGVATGAQQSFDWRGVAVSAIVQGVGQGVGTQIKGWSLDSNAAMDSAINVGARSAVAGFVGGVVSTAARGGSLGRNVGAITMDAMASTIGNAVVDQMAASPTKIYGYDDGNTPVGGKFQLADRSDSANGMTEGQYWNGSARTVADQYADVYGGSVVNASGRSVRTSGGLTVSDGGERGNTKFTQLNGVDKGADSRDLSAAPKRTHDVSYTITDPTEFLDGGNARTSTWNDYVDSTAANPYGDKANDQALRVAYNSQWTGGVMVGSAQGSGLLPAQEFVNRNGSLYDSTLGGGAYGIARVFGASDGTARAIGAIGNSVEMGGAVVTGAPFAKSRTVSVVGASEANTLERSVLFGQRRVGPAFGTGGGRPDYISGRLVSDVAADLRNGVLHPDQFPVEAFYFNDSLVSVNTRTLSALSEAGMVPTKINIVEPSRNVLRRLQERPLIPDAPLPGPRVPVTPSQTDLTILRTIKVPGSR